MRKTLKEIAQLQEGTNANIWSVSCSGTHQHENTQQTKTTKEKVSEIEREFNLLHNTYLIQESQAREIRVLPIFFIPTKHTTHKSAGKNCLLIYKVIFTFRQ